MEGYCTIGGLAERTGLNPKTIRYYEQIGLITTRRDQNGYRIYSIEDERQLIFIKRAKLLGLTLNEIGLILQDVRSGFCTTARSNITELLQAKISETTRQIDELVQFRAFLIQRLEELNKGMETGPAAKKMDCTCLGQ